MTDTRTVPDAITVSGRLHDALLAFVADTALSACTSIAPSGYGTDTVTALWPVEGWSTGERTLWRILRSLTEGDLFRAFDRCDVRNVEALCDVFAAMRAEVAA